MVVHVAMVCGGVWACIYSYGRGMYGSVYVWRCAGMCWSVCVEVCGFVYIAMFNVLVHVCGFVCLAMYGQSAGVCVHGCVHACVYGGVLACVCRCAGVYIEVCIGLQMCIWRCVRGMQVCVWSCVYLAMVSALGCMCMKLFT